jgi:hypothetical protein
MKSSEVYIFRAMVDITYAGKQFACHDVESWRLSYAVNDF